MKSGGTLVVVKQQELLSRKISELPLKIEATHLQELIFQLYKELEEAGIAFKPKTYLTNGWGCPDGVPVIGIPFYLADPILDELQTRMTGRSVDDDVSVMKYLRHEAGHTLNYAYRLYDDPEWQRLFGCYYLPYRNEYKIDPFSNRFVRHLPGCYAQKHPDDDFAETFAVWLTPYSNWQKVYYGTPALDKLLYIDRVLTNYGRKSPVVTGGRLDMPIEEMTMTLREWYQMIDKYRGKRAAQPRLSTKKQVLSSRSSKRNNRKKSTRVTK